MYILDDRTQTLQPYVIVEHVIVAAATGALVRSSADVAYVQTDMFQSVILESDWTLNYSRALSPPAPSALGLERFKHLSVTTVTTCP